MVIHNTTLILVEIFMNCDNDMGCVCLVSLRSICPCYETRSLAMYLYAILKKKSKSKKFVRLLYSNNHHLTRLGVGFISLIPNGTVTALFSEKDRRSNGAPAALAVASAGEEVTASPAMTLETREELDVDRTSDELVNEGTASEDVLDELVIAAGSATDVDEEDGSTTVEEDDSIILERDDSTMADEVVKASGGMTTELDVDISGDGGATTDDEALNWFSTCDDDPEPSIMLSDVITGGGGAIAATEL